MQAARGASLTPGEPHPTETASRRPRALFVGVALVVFVLDQTTKILAVHRLEGRPPHAVLGDFFELTIVRNPGAAFSTGTSATVLLTCFAIVAAVVTVHFARRLGDRLWAFGLGCLLGGILGNLSDRMLRSPGPFRGHVVDFFHLTHWPVFNIADVCIDIAAAILIIQSLRGVPLRGRASADVTSEPTP